MVKTNKPKLIRGGNEAAVRRVADQSVDVLILNSKFAIESKDQGGEHRGLVLTENSKWLVDQGVRMLKPGGLLLVYGLPQELPFFGEYLDSRRKEASYMIFKYWLALDIDKRAAGETLQPAHMGVLLYLKSSSVKSQSPFHLNTKTVRVSHRLCTACGLNVKDWGGKKHLMHPDGTALSDVWRDLPKTILKDHRMPSSVERRLMALTDFEGARFVKILQEAEGVERGGPVRWPAAEQKSSTARDWQKLDRINLDEVYCGDSISFLERVAELHPGGLFDLVFADPPYNLSKGYNSYDDALGDQHYIEWCNRWLHGMAKTLKPGGALFVLNLPKWAIHHATFLEGHLEFRHWIVWDALSDPRGKLMPAHYALLYYTKAGAKPVLNYAARANANGGGETDVVQPPDSPQYCLRGSCVKRRKQLGDARKVDLSDVWFDVHRIKHKRDRDAHPCQLPERLMERLVLLSTKRGGVVFDPFCGAGTTAIASVKLGRRFVTVDMDEHYVEISRRKLAAMRANADLFGYFAVPRETVRRTKKAASKKEIETYLQALARRLGREPAEADIEADQAVMLEKIDAIYPSRLEAIKRCRVVLNAATAS